MSEPERLIEILGPGCARCEKLADNARSAVAELGIEAEVEKVTDINQIIDFGVMITPALALDGEVKSAGKVLSVEEIKHLLSPAEA
jgi:small redox-active disulfide protein 2